MKTVFYASGTIKTLDFTEWKRYNENTKEDVQDSKIHAFRQSARPVTPAKKLPASILP
jgi:hypothetical protein